MSWHTNEPHDDICPCGLNDVRTCDINDQSTTPTADFEAAHARWKAAEDAEEATVERVARAMEAHLADSPDDWTMRGLARAAVDALTTPVRQEAGR